MRKILSLAVGVTLLLSSVFVASPTFAACILQYPTIGTINATNTSGDYTSFTLDHANAFNASLFPAERTDLDQYNALAVAFKQNNYQVPAAYAYQFQSGENTSGFQANLRVEVPTAALNTVSYHTGDILIMGPPGGASCLRYGFIGFFGQNGTIQSAIAYDSGYAGYAYGSETLSLDPGTGHDCTTSGSGSTCTVPITYSVNGSSFILNPGDSRSLSDSHFTHVTLVQSTKTTLQGNVFIEEFDPIQLLHTMTFQPASNPPPPPPPPKSCPMLLRNLGRGSRGTDVSTLQGFLISAGLLENGSATGYFGLLTEHAVQGWQAAHGLIASGSPSTTGYGAVGPRTRAALARCNAL
jgi:peptidoglycan hydrolase-like protein with peptidoglycan-binding domain